MNTIQEEQIASDEFFKNNPVQGSAKTRYFKALDKIIDVCDEERVFERGEREQMLEDKIDEIRATVQEYKKDITSEISNTL